MFNTLESTWDRSARRGWTTLASFGFQAMAVSLLLLVPLIYVQGPPKITWFESLPFLTPPSAPAPPTGATQHHAPTSTNLAGGRVVAPRSVPDHVAMLDEQPVGAAPNLDDGVPGGTGDARNGGVWRSLGNNVEAAPPPVTPAPDHPIKVSHWAEGNVIYRVQPVYPPLARQARIQGPVELRAIISKTGVIENLQAISGHPMLIPAALSAVRQWRYRPYLLNDEPIAIDTEITVNFILAAN
jgi:periplasmic protein TonB